ncbi:MAG: septum formation initiator family protein [Actinomyces sp.]|uniref:FtsB family cell division protein n=1 Tax=Actinomyces sp. TaxID=29317 RepID=UPI0025D5CCBE|nr:septum formation initiator family protein [Actinomyces sp.]MDU1431113.1 septum formation initiator family protein [Actinomyces sp.]
MAQKPRRGRPVVPNARRSQAAAEPDTQRRPRQGGKTPRTRAQGTQSTPIARTTPRVRPEREASRPRAQAAENAAKRPSSVSFGGIEISMRILGLLLLGALLALLLVPSFMQLWSQERELAAIKAKVQQTQADNDAKRQQLELWSNPQYIASQARERLGYVKPGETQYSVLDPGKDYQDQAQVAAAREAGPARPWMQVLSLTVEEADHPTGNIQTAQTGGNAPSPSQSATPENSASTQGTGN